MEIEGVLPQLRQNSLLPTILQFIINLSPYHLELCDLATDNNVVYEQEVS
jgi:hypothetical protein